MRWGRTTLALAASLGVFACVDSGQVLNNELASTPEPAASLTARVSASGSHACAVVEGRGYCWGSNESGQLGIGTDDAEEPLGWLEGRWLSIVAGQDHTCGLTTADDVYCWGDNQRGQLGQGDRASTPVPARVPLAGPVRVLATGFSHACALLEDGALWCWGDGYEGQLAQDDVFVRSADDEEQSRDLDGLEPVLVPAPLDDAGESIAWRDVDTGEGHSCAIAVDGALWCWGRNSQRQLGAGSDGGQSRVPLRVGEDHDWQTVDAAQNYTCALKADGSLWCFGYNMGTRTGAGNPFGLVLESLQLDEPSRVNDSLWSSLSTNMFHTCALGGESGQLWCWGRNVEGQLGLDPEQVPELTEIWIEPRFVTDGIAQVSAGRFSTCLVTADAAIRCAGQNADGQLGGGGDSNEFEFIDVALPPDVAPLP
jgi:alpha-tubulin suppressor-like RCC1 family protein